MLFGMKKGWLVGGGWVRMCIVYLVRVDLWGYGCRCVFCDGYGIYIILNLGVCNFFELELEFCNFL